MIDYSPYANFVERICQTNDLSNFKSNLNYTYMLEHVTTSQGSQYIDCIKQNTSISSEEIIYFCNKNDSIGNPTRGNYDFGVASPTSLRYIYHAHLILTYLQSLNLPSIDIVELGGGYGGLCLAIYNFSEKYSIKINSYTIIDLPSISKLQSIYITLQNPDLNVSFMDATTFGSNIQTSNLFFVSNYCFSEISHEFQQEYIKNLFPKVTHGFITWNHIPVYDFGFTCKVEDERPLTLNLNKYVYF
jgi:hypothetical protein